MPQPAIGTGIFTEGDPYGRGQMHVADVRGWGHLTGQGGGCAFDEDKAIAIQTANANLIAAAPDLLDALHVAYKTIRALHGTIAPGLWDNYCSTPQMQTIIAAIKKAEGL